MSGMIRWLFVFPIIAASIHVIEEFIFPGEFRQWYMSYRPEVARFLTTPRLIAINVALIAACASFAITGPRHGGTTTWLIVVSIIAWNSVFHILGSFRTRAYSPGMSSAILLYLPLAIGGSYELLRHDVSTISLFAICVGIGTLYHVIAESDLRFKWERKNLAKHRDTSD